MLSFPGWFRISMLGLVLSMVAGLSPSAGGSTPSAAGDELLVAGGNGLAISPLPRGPVRPGLLPLADEIEKIAVLDDGRLVAVTYVPGSGSDARERMDLVEIEPGGQLVTIGEIARDPRALFGESPIDLVVDGAGELYLFTAVVTDWNPPDGFQRLVRLDPTDATSLSSVDIGEHVGALATAPQGLWAVGFTLQHLDPATGALVDTSMVLPPFGGFAAATDSTGALWIAWEGVCSPPCFGLYRFDPVTGAVRNAPASLYGGSLRDLAVRRRCLESTTARCLQGGRFRAEISWQDFQGTRGPGRAAAGRSADTALFWFFDPANWELMVKVLDGCEIDGHFWVFASASTSVEYTLTVTDLETGAVQTYDNPLGEIARSVTDTAAFACP